MAGHGFRSRSHHQDQAQAAHGGGHHGGRGRSPYADFHHLHVRLFMFWLLTRRISNSARQSRATSAMPACLRRRDDRQGHGTENRQARPLDACSRSCRARARISRRCAAREGDPEKLEQRPSFAAVRDNVQRPGHQKPRDPGHGLGAKAGRICSSTSAARGLKPALVELLGTLATELGKLPNRIEIGGHTDARPFATRAA